MNEILTSDGAILWRGQERPLKMAVLLTRQRPWLTLKGGALVRRIGDRERSIECLPSGSATLLTMDQAVGFRVGPLMGDISQGRRSSTRAVIAA